ncbi:IS110 family transposase [Xylanivirga thermophila]|uniref:IS110 family transposase n=1 Tax=Xylanivirga thermophila TaxID=2496273 RepID=UPI0039F5F002
MTLIPYGNFTLTQTLVVGVDIAKKVHYARAFDYRGIELGKVFKFENTREGLKSFRDWMVALEKKEHKSSSVVGMEPTGHYWLNLGHFLKDQEIRLVLVNPFHVKRSKELDDNTPSKSDSKDPKTIAKLMIDGRYSEPYIPEGVYSELRTVMNLRDSISKSLIRIKNQVIRWLDQYFPEFMVVFKDWEGKAALMTLREFPTPDKIVSMGIDGVVTTWKRDISRGVGVKRATQLVKVAKGSIGIREGLRMAEKELSMLLGQYDLYKEQLAEVEHEMEKLALQIPGVQEMLTIKGVGITTAAGFMAEVGDVSRFSHPKQIQKLAGLNLVENNSGKHKGNTTISKRGRSRLRAVLFRAVMPLVSKNEEFKALHNHYTTRRENPLKKMQSLILLCCKLIRIFYALISKQVAYDSERVIRDLNFLQLQDAA